MLFKYIKNYLDDLINHGFINKYIINYKYYISIFIVFIFYFIFLLWNKSKVNLNDTNRKYIRVTGSDTLLPLSRKISSIYLKFLKKKNTILPTIYVNGGGSGLGIKSLINGTSDLVYSSRLIKKRELDLLSSKNRSLATIYLCKEVLGIIINKNNPIKSLSLKNLFDIFSGKKRNWSNFGGLDREIVLYGRNFNSGTASFIASTILHDTPYSRYINFMNGIYLINSSVSYDLGGISYIGIDKELYEKKDKLVKFCNITDIKNKKEYIIQPINTSFSGSMDNLVKYEYPLVRMMYLYTTRDILSKNPHISEYFNYIKYSMKTSVFFSYGFLK